MKNHGCKYYHLVLHELTLKWFFKDAPFGNQVSKRHFNPDAALGQMEVETVLVRIGNLGFCKRAKELVAPNIRIVTNSKQRDWNAFQSLVSPGQKTHHA